MITVIAIAVILETLGSIWLSCRRDLDAMAAVVTDKRLGLRYERNVYVTVRGHERLAETRDFLWWLTLAPGDQVTVKWNPVRTRLELTRYLEASKYERLR